LTPHSAGSFQREMPRYSRPRLSCSPVTSTTVNMVAVSCSLVIPSIGYHSCGHGDDDRRSDRRCDRSPRHWRGPQRVRRRAGQGDTEERGCESRCESTSRLLEPQPRTRTACERFATILLPNSVAQGETR